MKTLSKGQVEAFRIGPTDSMRPLSLPGGMVILAHWPWEKLMVGMVIGWKEKDRGEDADPIDHQIVHIDKGSICRRDIQRDPTKWKIWCKGINNPKMDKWEVTIDEYIGVNIGSDLGDYPYANMVLQYNGQRMSVEPLHPEAGKYFPKKLIENSHVD